MTSLDLNNVNEAESDAMAFMHDIEAAISSYYESGTTPDSEGNPCQLIQQVMSHNYIRLDNFVPGTNDTVSIRMYLASKLNPQF